MQNYTNPKGQNSCAPHLGVLHQHIFTWDPNVVQLQVAVIHLIKAKFGANVTHNYTCTHNGLNKSHLHTLQYSHGQNSDLRSVYRLQCVIDQYILIPALDQQYCTWQRLVGFHTAYGDDEGVEAVTLAVCVKLSQYNGVIRSLTHYRSTHKQHHTSFSL